MAIALSAGVRTNLLSLQSTAQMLTQTQEKLSTGKKVNSALDNPTNFFTAQALTERASSLTSLQDGINTGVQTVKAANKGLDTITTLLKQAKSIAEQAKNAGNGAASAGVDAGTAIDVTGTAAGSVLERTRAASLTTNGVADTETLIFTTTKGGVQEQFTFTASATLDTVGELVDAVNNSGVATAKINDNGTLSFDAAVDTAATPAETFTITGTGATATDLGFAAFATAARTPSTTANGQDYVSQYADVMTAINDAVTDASFNGINLLQGGDSNKLTVTFDGASKSKIDVDSKSFSTSGMSVVSLGSGNADAVLTSIDTALNTVKGSQGEYGNKLAIMQTRLDFSKELSNMLEVGADNLTLADTNKEAANLLALQTRQSLSQSALSLANQSDQAVLQLLR
ncbi:hypothetical protein IP69_15350 [Bosea sp. AAP35]|uniref:flagellin N-terminal helical domain-containing protein n=1 Tax=Bosea sp. AAP35 TaxID=1523417 RepID=UPI0006B99858|nr:flagellin [Bosea sp. AAP35]KPF66246.1 hypothetical protein IP69_15350 [Bosea sp. AAP35]